ncbi:MAG: copper chaperone PCu(A)C [Alphaproteobacteria bacterium]|nr:copper chaperone PCu(A)C [Alphaproteobacteria bacterium]
MKRILIAAFAALFAFPALAADIKVDDAWARPTLGQARNGAAYLTITTTGAPDRLVAASAPVAGKTELHSMTMNNNVMQMRPVDAIQVTPGTEVKLQPGGLHVMLLDLKSPLKLGEKFPLTLKFERGGEVQVQVEVRQPRAGGHGQGH